MTSREVASDPVGTVVMSYHRSKTLISRNRLRGLLPRPSNSTTQVLSIATRSAWIQDWLLRGVETRPCAYRTWKPDSAFVCSKGMGRLSNAFRGARINVASYRPPMIALCAGGM